MELRRNLNRLRNTELVRYGAEASVIALAVALLLGGERVSMQPKEFECPPNIYISPDHSYVVCQIPGRIFIQRKDGEHITLVGKKFQISLADEAVVFIHNQVGPLHSTQGVHIDTLTLDSPSYLYQP